mmetsp:Transcript_34280/g.67401  ORF Transcript_34280/g.67401 Transcript_34280/m.67401 type:complete len:557 (-) Transcript_34280:54-1724(-)
MSSPAEQNYAKVNDSVVAADTAGHARSANDTNPAGGQCSGRICRWMSIPYAEPLRRFAPSVPRTTFGVPATPPGSNGGFGPACIQSFHSELDQSEECLTLNVWAPDRWPTAGGAFAAPPPLPVMVWIHGGAFLAGSASDTLSLLGPGSDVRIYDGAALAARGDVVVVSVQYRLGPFGFLQRADGGGGSNGILDQLTALRWLEMHIGRFGGDPDAVTIFGESSGSVSACVLLHSPAAAGLFKGAILQSGSCYPSIDLVQTTSQGATARATYMEKLGIRIDSDYLETAEPEEIVNHTLSLFSMIDLFTIFAPSLTDLPVNLAPLPGVNVMTGITSADQTIQTIPGGKDTLLRSFGVDPADIDTYSRDSDLFLDACLRCQEERVARRTAVGQNGTANAYFYVYDCPGGAAAHAADIFAVFGNVDWDAVPAPGYEWPSNDLIGSVQDAWTAFGRTGDPGWGGVGGDRAAMSFGCDGTVDVPMDAHGSCDMWTSAADILGGRGVTDVCAGDYLAWMGEAPDTSYSALFSAPTPVVVVVVVMLFLSLTFRISRRRGYSAIST